MLALVTPFYSVLPLLPLLLHVTPCYIIYLKSVITESTETYVAFKIQSDSITVKPSQAYPPRFYQWIDYLKNETISRSRNWRRIQSGISACVMSSEYFTRTPLYLVRLEIFEWIKLLRSRASDISRKKSKLSRDFQGQIRGKIGRFRGIFTGRKSKFAEKSADFWYFCRKKSKFAEKSADFAGFSRKKVKWIKLLRSRASDISRKKSKLSQDFQRQILRKTGWFHGKFRGETSPWNNQ